MYSLDRAKALEYTISCLRDMPLYENCQKTLVVDGKIDVVPHDWEVVQVPRINDKFCWGRMWDAGVLTAMNEKIIYLDSDRLLPKNYLELVNEYLKEDLFLYTSSHFLMTQEIPVSRCKQILTHTSIDDMLSDEASIGAVRYDPRHGEPYHGPGKNVMSGSTAFTRKTYLRLGGVDHWYCGHGAFADTDFHYQAASGGCNFLDLNVIELHYPHLKLDDKSQVVNDQKLWMMSLDNFIYYCSKWNLPLALAENMASRCGVERPNIYVGRKVKELKGVSKVSS